MTTKNTQTTYPYNLEAEQSILGCILIDIEYQYEIASELSVDDFYLESHKHIFERIQSMLSISKHVDLITVSDEMSKIAQKSKKKVDVSSLAEEMERKTILDKVGGIAYLTILATSVPSSANYKYYLNIVKRDAVLRRLIRASEEIIKDAKTSNDDSKSLQKAEKLIYDISEKIDTSSLQNAGDTVDKVLDLFGKIQTDKNFLQGLNTGFTCFDNATHGLHEGNLVIIAARPSVGKSTLAMNIVENVALRQNAVSAVFALEMTREEIVERMIYTLSGVPSTRARKGELSTDDWQKMWSIKTQIKENNIYIDDTPVTTVQSILSKCRRLKALKGRLDLVVVDHMQLMTAVKSSENRQAEITEISRGLKMVAKELKVPVIALSQLRRLPEGQKPSLVDLRESGSIEQDADIVLFIHRPNLNNAEDLLDENGVEIKKDECLILLQKNRSGPLCNFKLSFNGELSKFVNIAPTGYGEPTQKRQVVGIEPPPEQDDDFGPPDGFED